MGPPGGFGGLAEACLRPFLALWHAICMARRLQHALAQRAGGLKTLRETAAPLGGWPCGWGCLGWVLGFYADELLGSSGRASSLFFLLATRCSTVIFQALGDKNLFDLASIGDGFWVDLDGFWVHVGVRKAFRQHSKQEPRKSAFALLSKSCFGTPRGVPKSRKMLKMGSQKSIVFLHAFQHPL